MRIFRKHLLLCVLIALFGGNAAEKFSFDEDILSQDTDLSQNDNDLIDYRLPTSVKPISYDLLLIQGSWDNFEFEGSIVIEAEVITATDNITLHVGNLKIKSNKVFVKGETDVVINKDEEYDNVTQKYTFILNETLAKDTIVQISIEYESTLNENMIGFYRSSYVDENGQIKRLAATQFQTTHARHAFPCFDEPSFKAVFNISIMRKEEYISLSNMPMKESTKTSRNGSTYYVDKFEQSVPMSTYLVAFIISEFDSRGTNEFKVWARPAAIDQANYALKIGNDSCKLLEELFDQKYTLPKMDMVAVPDFAAGAMENWGLVTYREARMLYDVRESSALAQQSVASVIVHEITHMWFGNLVTPEWWGCLWLSEAFARFFQYFGTAQIEVDWNMEEQFVVEQHQAALVTDSLKSSRPLTREVSSQSEIGTMGDSITYAKGASVVRMMDLTFGVDLFKNALRAYLQNNKQTGLGNPDALWKAIQDQIDQAENVTLKAPVSTIMDTWTTQPGYPIVSVTVNKGVLHVTQERFLLRNFFLDESPTNATWWVPLTWTTQSDPNFNDTSPKYWLSTEKDSVDIKVNSKDWIIFNVQSSGFYRVRYDLNGWKRIFKILNSNKFNEIHVLNRASIVDDLLNLGRAGYEDYQTVLDGLTYLKQETNYLPFKAALNGLDYMNKRFMGREKHYLLKKYILSLIDDRRKTLGYEDREDDDRLTILLRHELNKWACNLDDESCIITYMDKFKKWKADASVPIKPNERPTAYCVAIRHGTSEDWDFLWEKYFNSNYAADQTVILRALGCTLDTKIMERYLWFAISDYESWRIRKQDSTSVFSAVYNSGLVGAEYILEFVEKYYEDMEKYYNGQDTIATILNGASQRFSTPQLVEKFQKFLERHKTKLAPIYKSLESSLNTAQYELKWYLPISQSIVHWIQGGSEYRLPTNILPRKYFVSVTPHLEIGNFTFDGNVRIEADVVQETNRIILHTAEIKVHMATVTANEEDVEIVDQKEVKPYDFYVIDVSKNLPAGAVLTIEIAYEGHLNASELRGFYKSSYMKDTGETRWLAATHLEPVGARKMFPCFDEPGMKAVFTVQVNVPPGYHPISNTKWRTVDNSNDDFMQYTFFETVKMSTYLVALVVSDFELKSAGQLNKVDLGVYARPNAINQTEYAALVIPPLVNFFEQTLKHKYQMRKLDMIALPDFPSGAGENWGLITYRETNLLYDDDHSPFTSKQTIRNVIAHELSHQWFGNLVTLAWWKYLWLNEGFARYFEYYAPAHAFNDTTLENQFVVGEVHTALSADGSRSVHALNHDVYTPTEIRGRFSTISYAKGASILRMIEKSYGSTVFYEALSDYLDDRQYDVATPEDLYKALQAQVRKAGIQDNVTTILDTWTRQPGCPIVHVTVDELNNVNLEQERFFLEKREEDEPDDTVWNIPITWTPLDDDRTDYLNTTPAFWMTTKRMNEAFESSSHFIVNVQQSGYYRVNYNENHWEKLISYLQYNFSLIHEINRAALIDDVMNFARADYISYETAISATMYLQREDDYLPWRAFYNNLPYLKNRFRGRGIEDLYKTYLTSLIQPLYERLNFVDGRDDDDLTKLLRMHTRKWACELDIGDCKVRAKRYFQNKLSFRIEIPPIYRSVVYCTAMQTDATENTYNILWEEYLNSTVTTDTVVILNSLACSQNKDVLEKLLREAITEDSSIRYQDSARMFSNVYDASLNGTEFVMGFIDKYYDDMQKYYGGYAQIESIVSSLASRISTYNLYKQYQDLLNKLVKREFAFDKSVRSFMTKVEYEFDWYDRKVPIIFEKLDNMFSSEVYRLPNTLHPEYYNIHLEPNMEEGTFEGEVQIYMRVKKETTAVVLNVQNIKYHSIKVYRNYKIDNDTPDVMEVPLQNYKEYRALQQLRIYLQQPANTDYLMAEIKFSGTLNDDMKGFYRSFYKDSNGEHHWLATTQFEPTYARRAFPCFDEPAFKSKFIINIKRPNHYKTLSNMPILYNQTEGNYTRDRFATNNIDMSPYLVAFIVSEFERADESEEFLNVWSRREIAMHGQFAQDTGKSLIYALQNFTKIDYKFPKLDLVAVPDFEMGAMENWGLATFREYALFFDAEEATASQEKYVITIIAHELAHMWFGNLVTCEWWEYVWLNEGFAQYFEYFASDMIQPDYKFMHQFVVYELQPALLKDASASTHPMTNPVETPEEISGVFDYVAYAKSASVLRMIFNVFKPSVQAMAISTYLHDYSGKKELEKPGTVRPEYLWESFNLYGSIIIDYKNVSISEVMSTWTDQPGYPVVNAVLSGDTLTLTQKRFLLNEWIEPPEKRRYNHTFYWVPIDIVTSLEPYRISVDNKGWLGPEAKTFYINPTNFWFIVNREQNGFYRVNYDVASWKQLIDTLNSIRFESIHVLNRAQIIDDLFNLARATHVEYELLMDATKYLMRERSHLPWKAFFNGLSYVYERFERFKDVEEHLTKYVLRLMSGIYDTLGFEDQEKDEHLDKLNRELVLQWACKLRKPECTKKSKDLFAAWRGDTSKRIPRNARAAVYCTAIRDGTTEDWKFLWQKYQETNFASEKKMFISALGCSADATNLQTYLRTAVEEYNIPNATFRKQDVAAVFSSVYSASQLGVNVVLDFLINNINDIVDKIGNWDKITPLFHNMASHISDAKQYEKLKKFAESYMDINFPDIKPKLDPAITTAKINLMWYDRNRGVILQWMLNEEDQENIKPTEKPDKDDNGSTMLKPLNACLMAIITITLYLLNYY
ncbi:hypothetical protein DMN91_001369 [Ooceraea biroi]|uniref:Aminopeptidase N n=1 Tax=Ooceraea biroi TaxID=2015173 RepID=A0A3L8E5F4_OOCBI|nr:putative aminopeptidase-2 [Ooceraea biroi]RLU27565.1 hypothetical protein DMN91_001369 [Ooceraea biroi]